MFDTLIPDAQTFLRDLAKTNTRDWFHAHKSEYDAKLRDPAKALLEEMAPRLGTMTGYALTTKLFRANRDVRFSKDKTPYTTHLHMMWAIETDARQNPVFFFGINTGEVTVGAGMMEFNKDVLMDWRKMADLDGGYLQGKLDTAAAAGFTPWEPKLKRVPPPYDKEHPHGSLLRQKGLVLTGHPVLDGDLTTGLERGFAELWPVCDMLIGVAETPRL